MERIGERQISQKDQLNQLQATRPFPHVKKTKEGARLLSFTGNFDRAIPLRKKSAKAKLDDTWVRISVPSADGTTKKARYVAKETLQKQFGLSSGFINNHDEEELAKEIEKSQVNRSFNRRLKNTNLDRLGVTKQSVRRVAKQSLAKMIDQKEGFGTALVVTKEGKARQLIFIRQRGRPVNVTYVDKRLGSGSYSTAFAASSIFKNGKGLAVKRPNRIHSESDLIQAKEGFIKEQNAIKKVRARGIQGRSYAILAPDDRETWLIGPCYSKGTLHTSIEKGRLSDNEIVYNTDRLFHAVEKSHKNGVIHKDIKPANILLKGKSGNEKLYLSDWGGAVHVDDIKEGFAGYREGFTVQYCPVFEIANYMDDAALGEQDSKRAALSCDVFATGMTLAQLWVGDAKFTPFETLMEDIQLTERGWKPGARERLLKAALARFQGNGELAARTVNLIAACLSPSYKNRPTAAEAAAEYRDILECWENVRGK